MTEATDREARGGARRRRLRILFAGAYGIRNAGDDLPLVVMADLLRRKRPDVDFELRALSRHPDPWEEERFSVAMVQNVEYPTREEAAGRWFRGLNPGDDPAPLEETKREIRACDALVLGAGNWLIDKTIGVLRGPIPLLWLYVFLADLYQKPAYLFGMSAGPIQTEWGRDLTRWIVERAALVTVRDEPSRALLEALTGGARTIQRLPDVTLAARPEPAERCRELLAAEGIERRGPARWLAVGLRDLAVTLAGDELEAGWAALAKALGALRGEVELLFVPQCTYPFDDDRQTARRFAERLDPALTCHFVEGRYHPAELIGFYGLCDAAVTVRLHAAVFSAIAGTPAVALDYLPKVRGFMESIGFERSLVPLHGLEASSLEGRLRAALDLGDEERARLGAAVARASREAEGYADLLLDLLLGAKDQGNSTHRGERDR